MGLGKPEEEDVEIMHLVFSGTNLFHSEGEDGLDSSL